MLSSLKDAKQRADRSQMLRDYSTLAEDLLYRLTDTARRIGELKAQLTQRGSGSPASPTDDYVSVLLVEDDGWLTQSLSPLVTSSFSLTTVVSGGEALDRSSERPFDLALIKENAAGSSEPNRGSLAAKSAVAGNAGDDVLSAIARKARPDRSAGRLAGDHAGQRVYVSQTAGRAARRASASTSGPSA